MMKAQMIIYDSEKARKKNASDSSRLMVSLEKLKKAGINVKYVDCKSASDVKGDGEAFDLVSKKGIGVLPLAEYDGALIAEGHYVSDQDLVDFLDVPNGVLSVNRSKALPLYETPAGDCAPQRPDPREQK